MNILEYMVCVALIILAINYKINCRDTKSMAEAACRAEGRRLNGYKPGLFSSDYYCGSKLTKEEIEMIQP